MSKVTTGATMSLDGFIADANHGGFEHLFAWYGAGDTEFPTGDPGMTFKVSAASAEHLHALQDRVGVLVCGRRLYDMTNAWDGRHPMDKTTVVLTHQRPDDRPEDDENFVFVTTGIEDAIARAKEIAGDKDVGVNGGEIARQCFDAGLLDEVHVDLVPVFLGSGIPLLGQIKDAPVTLEGPISLTQGSGVTHLGYRVVRK
ncbi:dihydrofolate reductase family protein [Phytohabitans sp. ZYX-F-186]|uniref:Dihydrofolate reductase family protein n=1 Tax=Phytohabitans maris TaxID=3071409 RepID=A0ABU0ZE83_9ACTN|nr:dihydrofolate reductase family protein [Phytohabitans sp. ZYX-F-186]MDQ7905365.1 dihydrofolate reductase family protein [Phytohabitans sp. ZYX-F-186]